MSKWGVEEQETLDTIENIGYSGKILNVAAGDGRFNNKILIFANEVISIDISETDLKCLEENCNPEYKNKLHTKVANIMQRFPFSNETFDGVFCTGTLHLFGEKVTIKILKEIDRVLKIGGKVLLDFATDIKRLDKDNNPVIFANEGNYHTNDAIMLFKKQLHNFNLDIKVSTFAEDNLGDTGYEYITGNFLIVSGTKMQKV